MRRGLCTLYDQSPSALCLGNPVARDLHVVIGRTLAGSTRAVQSCLCSLSHTNVARGLSADVAVSNLGQPLFCLSITWSRCRNAYRDLWIMTIVLMCCPAQFYYCKSWKMNIFFIRLWNYLKSWRATLIGHVKVVNFFNKNVVAWSAVWRPEAETGASTQRWGRSWRSWTYWTMPSNICRWRTLRQVHQGPFDKHGLTLIPVWISTRMLSNVWDEITYSSLNFSGSLEMDKKFHPTFYNGYNYISMLGLKLIPVSKRVHLSHRLV